MGKAYHSHQPTDSLRSGVCDDDDAVDSVENAVKYRHLIERTDYMGRRKSTVRCEHSVRTEEKSADDGKQSQTIHRLPQHSHKNVHRVNGELHALLMDVAKAQNVLIEDLTGRSQDADLVAIRRKFAASARVLGYSLPVIGAALHRHHTTVLNLLVGKGWQGR